MFRLHANLLLFLLIPPIARAGSAAPALAGETPNRSVPEHRAPAIGSPLSENASEEEIRSARIFSEPLIPVGRKPSAQENQQLAIVLGLHQQRAVPDDFSALEQFIEKHPDSAWAPAVTFSLASEYYNTGWDSKGLAAWQSAWR